MSHEFNNGYSISIASKIRIIFQVFGPSFATIRIKLNELSDRCLSQIASHVLGVPANEVHISETSTNTVPNTSSTAASVSSDLNGLAVQVCAQA